MIAKILKKIRNKFIIFKYKRFLRVGAGFTCGRGTIFYAQNKITVGENVYFGRYCNIECDSIIGNEVLIANNVGFIGRLDHDYTRIGTPIRFAPNVREKAYIVTPGKGTIVIGDDVWIGYGAAVLSGVTVGEGAIIASCSLVTKDVEPFSIVAGSPAKKVSMRFTPDEIDRHKFLCKKNYASYS